MTGKLTRSLAAVAVSATLGGCAVVGGGASGGEASPGVSYPDIAGAWMGALQIEGQGLNSMLDIAQSDRDLRITMEIPVLELTTIGSGVVLPDGTLRVSFRYELDCPGDAEFIGQVSADESTLEGTLLASDCTGDLRGNFHFSR